MNAIHAVSLICAAMLMLAGCATPKATPIPSGNFSDRPTNRAMEPIADVPGRPRVLLIGDSISIGYTLAVRQELDGVANVHRIPENGGPTSRGLERLDAWLGSSRWDVIHFNWGLHDLKLQADGGRQVPLEAYEKNLETLVDRLKPTGAVLVWASTTPVPAGVNGPPRDPADVGRYNAAAVRVMKARRIRINDLNAKILPRVSTLQLPRNVHFTDAGSAELGREVSRAIRAVLPSRRTTD